MGCYGGQGQGGILWRQPPIPGGKELAQKKGNPRVRQRRGIALLILGVCAVFVLITKLLAPRPGPQIILQWDFSAPGMVAPASFQVERADGESSLWRVVGHVAPTARTWTDQAVQPGTT